LGRTEEAMEKIEMDFNAPADATNVADADSFLITRAGSAMNVPGSLLLKQYSDGDFATNANGVIGTIIKKVAATPAGDSTRAIFGAITNGFGPTAGSIMIQPRTGVSASINFAFEGALRHQLTNTKFGLGTIAPAATFHMSEGQMPAIHMEYVANITWKLGNLLNSPSDSKFYIGFGSTSSLIFDTAGHILSGADGARNIGSATNRFGTVFASTGSINTSDARKKTDIEAIPDKWLDAWGAVQWSRFKMIGGTRWHTGLVAQQVHQAFSDLGIDAFEIGLCCHDAWDEERAPVFKDVEIEGGYDEHGNPVASTMQRVATKETEVIRPAGDLWGLRYEECFAMEAAWQRRENAKLHDRLQALES
jgi:Chaperone of endosialidase